MNIRLAQQTDVAAIEACAIAAYSPYIVAIGRKPAPMLADFAAQIAAKCVYVAENEDGILCGYIVFFQQDEAVLLESVAVIQAAQGQGVGKALVAFCEQTAQSWGIHKVCLYTNEKMTNNSAMYPKIGYVEVDRRSEEGFNRVYFEKVL
ncbi:MULTISPECIES: GNAT family N-acetyltransferase [Vitreoscilla]|uniref:GNAT family N-acetyltransferase n=1 Tax=Vitreoscilla stercoraria TaxID=61 RepID=A0ABY4E7Q0_VITST|nr:MULTISPECIES: GNAT family N-acetyltransferase [Vitreoscilla]AUZ04491.2 acyl-CoA N-acyltransferase [Vitreoscilla sp. C1]UOO91796.1 GNAT family N-acetyltransferase [Vitreoscilla stercoraria]